MRKEVKWVEIAQRYGFVNIRMLLEDWYTKKAFSSEEIAKVCNVSRQTILDLLRRFDIPIRPRGGANNSYEKKLKDS